MAAALAAGIGFLDAASERAFAADGKAIGIGRICSAQKTGGENQLVARPKRRAAGIDLAGDDCGCQPAAAKAFVFFGHIFKFAFSGGHIDP